MNNDIKVTFDDTQDIKTSLDVGSIQYGQLEIGTTTTGEAGTKASVTNAGSSSHAILNFTIPKGKDGVVGKDGKDGSSGVHIGSNPPANTNVWIDPNGEIDKIPTKTSELINDSNYATRNYVDNELATFDFIKVVDTLPEVGLPNKIYLVPKNDTQTQDLFDEYVWINNAWEWVTTKQIEVDLTPYAKTENFVTLTQAEYDALTTKDTNTYYYITEE